MRNLALQYLEKWKDWGCMGQQGMLDILVGFAELVVAQKTPTNSASTPFCPYYTKYGSCEQFASVGCNDCQLIDGVAEQRT